MRSWLKKKARQVAEFAKRVWRRVERPIKKLAKQALRALLDLGVRYAFGGVAPAMA